MAGSRDQGRQGALRIGGGPRGSLEIAARSGRPPGAALAASAGAAWPVGSCSRCVSSALHPITKINAPGGPQRGFPPPTAPGVGGQLRFTWPLTPAGPTSSQVWGQRSC